MAMKCVHKGCGKLFNDENENCIYHPGPPIFHEGQKGWTCCKPRVLTFDEFLDIPPCTTGKHSTVDDTPAPDPKPSAAEDAGIPAPKQVSNGSDERKPISQSALQPPAPRQSNPDESAAPAAAAAPESESDEPSAPIPAGLTCRRRGCGTTSVEGGATTECIYHPGQALFHEGSKGWTCCKKRVLEFDEFMKIAGCKTREKHCFIGKKRRKKADAGEAAGGEGEGDEDLERLATVRNDFYQTPTTVHASFYLKKIIKDKSRVAFRESGSEIELDLRTGDGKLYESVVPLFAKIDPEGSKFRILGTKLELTLAKADGVGWPVLRNDEPLTGEIIQTGRAGRA